MRCLTVRQPWAYAILHLGKDIENRDWPTQLRGRIAIHAAKGLTKQEYRDGVMFIRGVLGRHAYVPHYEALARGFVLGTVEIAGCVEDSDSPWFMGEYGFVLRNPIAFDVGVPATGALGFWEWVYAPSAPGGTRG